MDATKAYLARYEVDRRSIFVGNLPLGATEQQIRDIFEHYGEIQEISIRENASKFERKWKIIICRSQANVCTTIAEEKFAFAFVEFRSPLAVANAVGAKVRMKAIQIHS